MSNHSPDPDALPESILEMGKDYHEPPAVPRGEIWQAVRGELEASGLLTDGPQRGSVIGNLARDLIRRRIHLAVAGYAVVSWGLLQFGDYLVDSFLLSPHWNRMALAVALLLVPSVLLLAHHHGSSGKDRLSMVEKIGIPVNLALAVGVLFILFGRTDLGAATTSITVEDEEGNTVERVVVKQEFRKRTAWFFFDAGEGLQDEDSWMSYVVPDAILLDLAPDDFFDAVGGATAFSRLRSAGYSDLRNVPLSLKVQIARELGAGHLLDGDVGRSEDGFRITTRLHEAETGRLVSERSYEGPDVLALVDRITIELKDDLDIPARDGIEDLPASERFSTDPAALEAYARGHLVAELVDSDWATAIEHLSRAVDADPTFAIAQYALAGALLYGNRLEAALGPMRAAMDNLHRIPERFRFVIRADYYRYSLDFVRAEAVIEMWAALYPEDPVALQNLLAVQENRGDLEGMLATLESLYQLSPDDGDLLRQMARTYRRMAQYDASRAALEEYIERFPEDHTGFLSLSGLYRVQGEFTPAREYLERALLMEPTRLPIILEIARLDLRVGTFEDARAGYDRVLSASTTSREKVAAWNALRFYHEYRGELDAAMDAIEHVWEEASNYMSLIELLWSPLLNIETYLSAGRVEDAITLVEERRAQLQPPFDIQIHRADFWTAIHLRELDEAQSALLRAEAGVTAIGTPGTYWQNELNRARGRLGELQEDWEAALEAYRSLASDPDNSTIHGDIGRVLQQMGELFEAEEETRERLRVWPSSPRDHLQLAQLLVVRGDTTEAVEHLDQAMVAWANADSVYQPAQEARAMLEELNP